MSITTAHKPALWSPGDWNAFFGFGTNILVNMFGETGEIVFKAPQLMSRHPPSARPNGGERDPALRHR